MNKGSFFGYTPEGKEVRAYDIAAKDIEARILDRGAVVQSLKVFGVDVALGYDRAEDYATDTAHIGEIVGRVSNRVGGAKFVMNGHEYRVTANDGRNSLHGGRGFGERMWEIAELGEDRVTLKYISEDGEEGYPSRVTVFVTYTVADGALIIDYRAIPEGDTPISLTNHAYFNLNGEGDVLGHEAVIFAERYTEVDGELIPTGVRPEVAGGYFDFRTRRKIGLDCPDFSGYDHNFILSPTEFSDFGGERLGLAAKVFGREIVMAVYTDQPGVQFYTGNFLGVGPSLKGGQTQVKHGGFCLEAQIEPNSVKSGVGIYSRGEVYTQHTVYAFERV